MNNLMSEQTGTSDSIIPKSILIIDSKAMALRNLRSEINVALKQAIINNATNTGSLNITNYSPDVLDIIKSEIKKMGYTYATWPDLSQTMLQIKWTNE